MYLITVNKHLIDLIALFALLKIKFGLQQLIRLFEKSLIFIPP